MSREGVFAVQYHLPYRAMEERYKLLMKTLAAQASSNDEREMEDLMLEIQIIQILVWKYASWLYRVLKESYRSDNKSSYFSTSK